MKLLSLIVLLLLSAQAGGQENYVRCVCHLEASMGYEITGITSNSDVKLLNDQGYLQIALMDIPLEEIIKETGSKNKATVKRAFDKCVSKGEEKTELIQQNELFAFVFVKSLQCYYVSPCRSRKIDGGVITCAIPGSEELFFVYER